MSNPAEHPDLHRRMSRVPELPRGTRRIAIGTLVGQGSAAAATLFAVRHFDAADFGLMGTFAAVSIIAGTIGTGRLEAAIPIPNRDRRACAISTLALLLLVPTSVLTVLLCVTTGPSVLHLLHASRLEDALPLAGIGAWSSVQGLVAS